MNVIVGVGVILGVNVAVGVGEGVTLGVNVAVGVGEHLMGSGAQRAKTINKKKMSRKIRACV